MLNIQDADGSGDKGLNRSGAFIQLPQILLNPLPERGIADKIIDRAEAVYARADRHCLKTAPKAPSPLGNIGNVAVKLNPKIFRRAGLQAFFQELIRFPY